jgi:hypothetical protein
MNPEMDAINTLVKTVKSEELPYALYVFYQMGVANMDITEAVNIVLEDLYGTE